MPYVAPSSVIVKRSKGRGRGVFATCQIKKKSVIERSPTLTVPTDESDGVLGHYVYANGQHTVAMGLGYLSLYNHSRKPNAAAYDTGVRAMEIVALRDIKPDEEVTINYGNSFRKEEWY